LGGQRDLDDKAAVSGVVGIDGTTMSANGAVGDGETEAGAATGSLAGILDAIKRLEDRVQGGSWDARSVIADADERRPTVVGSSERQIDFRAVRGVIHRVANDVFKGAAEQVAVPHNLARGASGDANAAVLTAGFEIGIAGNFADEGLQVQMAPLDFFRAALEAGKPQKFGDELVEALGFPLDANKGGETLGACGTLRDAEGDAEAGQGRAEFVRNVTDQTLASGDESFELFGHVIEVLAEFAEFIGAQKRRRADTSGEIPLSELVCSFP
jgi:hypothetical protein